MTVSIILLAKSEGTDLSRFDLVDVVAFPDFTFLGELLDI